MKNSIKIFVVVLFFFTSCSSDDAASLTDGEEMIEDPIVLVLLLKNIKLDNQIIKSYVYDSEDRILEAQGTFTFPRDAVRYKATYENNSRTLTFFDKNDMIVKIEIYYNQSGNTVRIEDISVITNEVNFYALYTLNNSDCNIDMFEFKYPDDETFYTSIYTYNGLNCNYERENIFLSPQDPSRVVVKHDDKNYYGKWVYATNFTTTFSRNVLENTEFDRDNEVMNDQSYSSVYEYNEDEYPISEVRTYLNGTVENYTYEYY
jgi:hypothetical protein